MELLRKWLEGEYGRGVKLARHLGVPASFVTKMGNGEKPIPVSHGAAIDTFTNGEVTRQEMFPNDWRRIWPELAALDTLRGEAPPASDTPITQPAEQGVA